MRASFIRQHGTSLEQPRTQDMKRAVICVLAGAFLIAGASFVGFIWYAAARITNVAYYDTRPELLELEEHLHKNESRQRLETFFGRGIPKPEEIHLYGPQTMVGRQHPFVAYYYTSTTRICVTTFKGYEIQLDALDRIVSWKRANFTLGC